jgi:hypothetical protein
MSDVATPSCVVNFIHILRAAFAPIFLCQIVISETLSKALSYKKGARKMLMKLRPATFFFEIVDDISFVIVIFIHRPDGRSILSKKIKKEYYGNIV